MASIRPREPSKSSVTALVPHEPSCVSQQRCRLLMSFFLAPTFFHRGFLVARRVARDPLKPQTLGLVVSCRKAIIFSPACQGERSQDAPAPSCFWTEKQSPSRPEVKRLVSFDFRFHRPRVRDHEDSQGWGVMWWGVCSPSQWVLHFLLSHPCPWTSTLRNSVCPHATFCLDSSCPGLHEWQRQDLVKIL